MTADAPDDEDVFHPMGASWQEGLEEALEDGDYDAELGMEMARDAMRVTKGELSEADFHRKYHDDVMAEFGVDDRPVDASADEDGEGRLESALSGLGIGEDTRRDVLQKMGVGAGAVGFAAWGASGGSDDATPEPAQAGEVPDDEEGVQWGMTLDLEHCDGCLSCVVACQGENDWDQGANWMYILDFEDETGDGRLIRPCQHCTDAPCEKVCPTTARHTRDEGGLVLTDYAVCIGCRYCQVACPYGVNYFQWDHPSVEESELDPDHVYDQRDRPVDSRAPRGVMEKCTFCPSRQDGIQGEEMVGTTACEDACPPEVIQFGDMNDPRSDPRRYADNPALGRTLPRITSAAPSVDALEESLGDADGTGDVEAVTDAVEDLDEESLAVLLAVDAVSDEETESDENSTQAEQTATVQELVGVLEDQGLDTEGEDVLVELDLAEEPDEDEEFDGIDEEMAEDVIGDYVEGGESSFRLLEDAGTRPNILYLGNEPGPEAEETDTPVAYEDVGQTKRRTDVLDNETVGF